MRPVAAVRKSHIARLEQEKAKAVASCWRDVSRVLLKNGPRHDAWHDLQTRALAEFRGSPREPLVHRPRQPQVELHHRTFGLLVSSCFGHARDGSKKVLRAQPSRTTLSLVTEASDTIVAMVGTRQCIRHVNASITSTLEAMDRGVIVVTGCAGGVDAHVKRECKRLGFRLIVCHARQTNGKWTHKGAGIERNTRRRAARSAGDRVACDAGVPRRAA